MKTKGWFFGVFILFPLCVFLGNKIFMMTKNNGEEYINTYKIQPILHFTLKTKYLMTINRIKISSQEHTSEVVNLLNRDIYYSGTNNLKNIMQSISSDVELKLNQKFNQHHRCEIVVNFEELDLFWMNDPVKIIKYIGAPPSPSK